MPHRERLARRGVDSYFDLTEWNTILVDGAWVPTFPNADYYFAKEEHEHWKDASDPNAPLAYTSDWPRNTVDGAAVCNDSVQPIVDASLVTFIDSDAVIAPGIRLVPSPEHTPGHVSVMIESEGQIAIITGDAVHSTYALHSIYQSERPEWSSVLDTDPNTSRITRERLVGEWADADVLVLGTHFGSPPSARPSRWFASLPDVIAARCAARCARRAAE